MSATPVTPAPTSPPTPTSPPDAKPIRNRRQVEAVKVGKRTTVTLILVSIVGIIAFGWPLLAAPTSTAVAHSRDAPWLFALLLPLVLAVVLAQVADGGLDAKGIAMLGVLAAVGTALRPLGAGIAGFEPVFVLLALGGRALGRGFGFALGTITIFSSAVLTGGVGPWLPFQMLAAGWFGFGAGCLPQRLRGRAEIGALALYAAIAAIAYGFLLNLSFWPWTVGLSSQISFMPGAGFGDNLTRWLAFCVTTSLGFDLPRAIISAVLVLILGRPILRAVRRATRRAGFDASVEFTAAAKCHPE